MCHPERSKAKSKDLLKRMEILRCAQNDMMKVWGITDGSAGMVAQVQALVHAIGVAPEMKKIALCPQFSWQPNAIYAAGFKHLILNYVLDTKHSCPLLPPWPDIVSAAAVNPRSLPWACAI